jgi:hypothetical protein
MLPKRTISRRRFLQVTSIAAGAGRLRPDAGHYQPRFNRRAYNQRRPVVSAARHSQGR